MSTPTEVSVLCEAAAHCQAGRGERGWRLIALLGSVAFTATGVLASVLGLLAEAGLSILAISPFDADDVLVKVEHLPRAVEALRACGHRVSVPGDSAARGLRVQPTLRGGMLESWAIAAIGMKVISLALDSWPAQRLVANSWGEMPTSLSDLL